MRAFRFSEQGSGAKTDNEDKSLHDTEFNYFYVHEKIMLYAVTAESCTEHCIMVNASADNESFRVKTNSVILEAGSLYRIFLKCWRDADGDYQLIYAEECRAETARLAGIEKGYRHKDNEFCVAVSSRSKIGIKLEGTAFIRREGLLLPCRASLILSQKIFPKTFNVPGRGVMLSFLGKISSSLRKGIVIDVSSVRFLTGTKESRRAFLEHIIGLVRENAERTVAAGFPELSEDFCAFDSLTVSFEKAGISPGEAMKALYRCIMTVSTGELKKLLSRGFSDNETGRRSVEQCCADLYYKYCFDALFRLRNNPYILLCSDEEADEKTVDSADSMFPLRYRSTEHTEQENKLTFTRPSYNQPAQTKM